MPQVLSSLLGKDHYISLNESPSGASTASAMAIEHAQKLIRDG